MFGPVSGTGRAMMASLQQAIQKGMPPDQAVQYVKSMATQGIAPMTDLYAMMNQFQRLKQQQVQPPQTPPTIKDQLNMAEQQQQMQRQQGGIAGMQAPPPAPEAMDRGLGAIDAGRMEYPKFAGGGIVAFQEGGMSLSDMFSSAVGAAKDLGSAYGTAVMNPFGNVAETEAAKSLAASQEFSDEDILNEIRTSLLKGDEGRASELQSAYLQKNFKNLYAAQRNLRQLAEGVKSELGSRGATSLMRPPKPPRTDAGAGRGGAGAGVSLGGKYDDFDKYRTEAGKLKTSAESEANLTAMQRAEQVEKDLAALGIGKAAEERTKYLDRREAEAGKQLAEDRRMALAQAGFAMAEAASRRGRERTGFLGAAAIGGTKGAQLMDKAVRENRALKDSIAENRLSLMQAQEMMKAGNYREGAAQAREAKQNLTNLNQALATNELGISKFIGEQKGADRRTGAQIAADRERYQAAADIKKQELLADLVESGRLSGDSDEAKQLRDLVIKNLGVDVGDLVKSDLAKYGY